MKMNREIKLYVLGSVMDIDSSISRATVPAKSSAINREVTQKIRAADNLRIIKQKYTFNFQLRWCVCYDVLLYRLRCC